MTSLIFPDINVWLALLLADHVHRESVKQWWESDETETLAFVRITQMGVLRLLTTAACYSPLSVTNSEAI
jgi:predicted nucleic acid-binding protein